MQYGTELECLQSISDPKHTILSHTYQYIPMHTQQSGGWGLVLTHSCPQFWHSKTNSNSTQFVELYFGVSKVLTANQMPSSWGSAPAQPGQLDWLAQTHYQDVSKSVAVAEGSNRLSWGKHATTPRLLQYWCSSWVKTILMLCRYQAVWVTFLFI